MIKMGKAYLIIAPTSWGSNGLTYRRNHLAVYLINCGFKVIWVYPVNRLESKIVQVEELPNKVVSVAVARSWSKDCTLEGLMELIDFDGDTQYTLWYSFPKFLFELSGIKMWNRIVYDCSDLWGNEPWMERKQEEVDHAEKFLIGNCDAIFATSPFLQDHIKKLSGKAAVVIENGVDTGFFVNHAQTNMEEILQVPSPRMGFVGGINVKLDFQLLYKVAVNIPYANIILVGPSKFAPEDFRKLIELPNVYCVGNVVYELVPSVMKLLDVGLLPYANSEYNNAVSPVKFFEYLASGIPVVGCNLPTTQKYEQQGVYYYAVSEDDFIQGCMEALEWKSHTYSSQRAAIAANNDWNIKFDRMTEF